MTNYSDIKDEELIIKYNEMKKELDKIEIEIEKRKKHIISLPILLQEIGNEIYYIQNEKNKWNYSLFEKIDKLKIDYSGKVGELFIKKICDKLDILHEFNDDKIYKDGTYDCIINKKKIEIKTARQSSNGSFQHESLRNGGCDYYCFIDITPYDIYITILPKFDLSMKNDIIKRKPHLRKGTCNVYKFDFSEKNIINTIKLGNSIKLDITTSFDIIKKFITKIVI